MEYMYVDESEYEEQRRNIEDMGPEAKFFDYQFQPEDERIIDPNDDVDDLMDLGPVSWQRAGDIPALVDADGKLHLFAGKIEPNDIKQGQIGDCYFLSSLAALAEKPDRIRNMFL
jgi:calpain-15